MHLLMGNLKKFTKLSHWPPWPIVSTIVLFQFLLPAKHDSRQLNIFSSYFPNAFGSEETITRKTEPATHESVATFNAF